MRPPRIIGTIKRRLLVNFRADPAVVQRLLPARFRPKLHQGHAIVGICLIRLEAIRPAGLPSLLGFSSDNAAHRIAVEWTDAADRQQEGVFIPRRDSGSRFNQLLGGRLFPGEHHAARFAVSDSGQRVDVAMTSVDAAVSLRVVGEDVDTLPASSIFRSLAESSAFFEGGSLGYSVTRDPGRLDGLRLHTLEWHVRGLAISEVRSSYFTDLEKFPAGSVEFDHALIMRDLAHEWHVADDMETRP